MAAGRVVLGGLPATGKTRALARRIGGAHVRVDTIEQAIVDGGLTGQPVGVAGCSLAYAVACDQLCLGLCVVADTVNPVEEPRAAWRAVATSRGLPIVEVEVEVVCSDPQLHRERARARSGDIADLVQPTWQGITAREYAGWSPDLRLDTARLAPDEAVAAIIDAAPWLTGGARHE